MQFNVVNIRDKFLVPALAVSTFFPALSFVFYIFIAVEIYIQIIQNENFSFKIKGSIPVLALLLYVIWGYFTTLYSDNIAYAFSQIEKGIPLLLSAGVLFFSGRRVKISFSDFIKYYWIGAVLSLLYICLFTLYTYFFKEGKAVVNVYGGGIMDVFSHLQHRTYYSALLALSLPILFKGLTAQKRELIIVSVLSIFTFIISIYLSGARAALIVVFALLSFLIFFYYVKKGNLMRHIPIVLVALVAAFIIVLNSPRIKDTMDQYTSEGGLEYYMPRLVSWNAAIEVIVEHPIFGVGIGDYQDELNFKYQLGNHSLQEKRNYNAHNQFLQAWLERGLIGLILLLAFFVLFPFKVEKRKRPYAISLVIVFFLNFCFESMLNRNLAIFPIAIWFIVLYAESTSGEGEDVYLDFSFSKGLYMWLIITLLFILASFLICNTPKEINYKDPRSYMSANCKILDYNDLPESNFFLDPEQGVLFNKDNMFFKNFSGGKFHAVAIYQKNDNSKMPGVKYTYWCYVSDDCNAKSVATYIYNPAEIDIKSQYDLSQKGTWQHLTIESDGFSMFTTLGIRINLEANTDMTGNIIFAAPIIDFDYIEYVD